MAAISGAGTAVKALTRYPSVSRKRARFIFLESDTEPCEVIMAALMVLLCLAFVVYSPTLFRNPAFALLGQIAPGPVWATVTGVLAVSKMLSAFYDSTRWRVLSVSGGALVWSLITGSLWAGGTIGIGTLIYPGFALISLWMAVRLGWQVGRKAQRE
jgi:hypothetical protein